MSKFKIEEWVEIRVCSKCGRKIKDPYGYTRTCPKCGGAIVKRMVKKK